ncbi:uncharacterized protein LOC113794566 isoform X3 [Dermatophagoides pteronyssinus]|uniref:uncharacterized protein LOC113794566 isoform X3 n=1 Tax=Dermatophagoides pteronyssinus TaxID=6956 RepID=UPI003F670B19
MLYQTIDGSDWKKNNNNNNNSNASNLNKNHFMHQSHSYHSIIHQQQQQLPQSNTDTNIVNKSIQNLNDDVLIENAELIEKLFPKCRPKTKLLISPSNINTNIISNNNKQNSMDYNDSVDECCNNDNIVNDYHIKNNDNDCSSYNIDGQSLSSSSIDLNNKKSKIQQQQQQSRLIKNSNRMNNNNNGKRLWNFMGISPSPSPPPLPTSLLSPVDDSKITKQQQKSDDSELKSKIRSINNNNNDDLIVTSGCSRDRSSSNETSSLISRKSISCGNETKTNNSIHQRPRRLKNHHEQPTIAAKLRLDNLLLSPAEDDSRIQNSKLDIQQCRQNNFDYDLNDEDDILFSRINMDRDKNIVDMSINKSIDSTNNIKRNHYNDADDDDHDNVNAIDDNNSYQFQFNYQKNDLKSRHDHQLAIAGGNELFSSSRSTRSKKRYHHHPINPNHQMAMTKSAVVKNKLKSNIGSMVIRPSFNFMDLAPSPDLMETNDNMAKFSANDNCSDKKIPSSSSSSTMPSSVAQFRNNKHSIPNILNQNNNELLLVNSSSLSSNVDQCCSSTNDSNKNVIINNLSAINYDVDDDRTMEQNPKYLNENDSSQQKQQSEIESTVIYKNDDRILSSSDINIDSVNNNNNDNNCATIELIMTNNRSSSSNNNNNNNKNRNKFKFIEHKHHSDHQSSSEISNNQECVEQTKSPPNQTTLLSEMQTKFITTTNQTMIDDDDDDDDENITNEMNLVCEKFVTDLKNKLSIVSKNTDNKDNVIIDNDDDDDDNIQTTEVFDNNNYIVDHNDIISESDYSSISIEKKSEFDINELPIARIIGSVPIAQYEGSPKRYGPKPGYPQRIISSSSSLSTNNIINNDYCNSMTSIQQQQQPIIEKQEPIINNTNNNALKSITLSSENDSPHSSSSSTSATFSSTDVNSSSSFSCQSNNRPIKKSLPSASGWRSTSNKSKIIMMANDSNQQLSSFEESSQNSLPIQEYNNNNPSNIIQQTQISCDEIVKSILNISNIETAIDSETDNASISAKPSPLKQFSDNNLKSEPCELENQQQRQEFDDNYMISSNETNKMKKSFNNESSLSHSITSFKSLQSNELSTTTAAKMTTLRKFSSTTNASTTGHSSDYLKMNKSGSLESSDDSNKSGDKYHYNDDCGSSSSSHFHRNKEFRKNYIRSHFTTQNDENELIVADSGISNNDLQLDQTSATSSTVDTNNNNNNNDNNNGDGNNRKSKLSSFICLSPELINGKDFLEHHQYSTHLDVDDLCLSGNDRDYYKDKISSSSIIPDNDIDLNGTNTKLMNIMPVLEDGLSSGLPSSDNDDDDDGEMMEYDDDADDDDDRDHVPIINNDQQQPLSDNYYHEYQKSNGRTVIGCETTSTANLPQSSSSSFNNNQHQTVNGDGESLNSNSYDNYYHNTGKQHQDVTKTKIINGQSQPSYFNVDEKNNNPYTIKDESNLTTLNSNNRIHNVDNKDSNQISFDNSNSFSYHQMITDETNAVRHNFPLADGTSNSLNQPKRIDITDIQCQTTGQLTGIPIHDNKYCPSSTTSNNRSNSHISIQRASMPNKSIHSSSSLSTNQNINTNTNTLSPRSTMDAVSNSPQSPPHSYGHNSYHNYYHHHHHISPQPSSVQQHHQQNYPNLSNSPTMLQSPNSPGEGSLHHHHHHHHNASSSSSASSAASSVSSALAHHGPPPPPSSSSSSINHHQYHHYHKSTQQLDQSPTQNTQSQPKTTVNSTNVPGTINNSNVTPIGSSSSLPASNVRHPDDDCDTDQETDRLLGSQRLNQNDDKEFYDEKTQTKRSNTSREVLIEGVLFRARYLGSTQLVCDGQPTKATRMMQAEEAVSRIKAPEGESQPSTEVDLFISTEKIMVLNTDLKEIMMDHALRTISYIADIGDLLVLMARRRSQIDDQNDSGIKRSPKMICHVFESEEAQYIAQSIGQAFQVAYMEFLKANGIKDSSFLKEMDYQEVLNSQEIFGDELEMFSKREKQKEVIVPKQKGEILGIVIVESGWGSMLPTVVIANLAQNSPSARCGQLNIGDQIIAINGISLVGLPLSTCQNYVKNTKNQTVVKFTIVPCPPVVEVKIKRPDTKYQLGFSVQNGVICSLLRGGIAERGGVRVGHRIIEINGQSVVAVPHDRIVNLLATSVGEIHMKTMPTSMFRLLTGQEAPSFM